MSDDIRVFTYILIFYALYWLFRIAYVSDYTNFQELSDESYNIFTVLKNAITYDFGLGWINTLVNGIFASLLGLLGYRALRGQG